jgi:ATP/maltotriose-dependent transcriptional regulator MalT
METDRFASRRMLFGAAVGSLWVDPSTRVGESIVSAAAVLDLGADDPISLAVMAAAGPPSSQLDVRARLDSVSVHTVESPDVALAVGFAATVTSQDDRASRMLSHAVDGFRAQRRLSGLAQALTLRCWSLIALSRFDIAAADAEEGAAAASRSGQSGWEAHALAASALLAALRGDDAGARAFADAADRLSIPKGAAAAIAAALIARGNAALAVGRHEEAVRLLSGIYGGREGGMAFQRLAAIADFAEACARSGDCAPARVALLEMARSVPSSTLSSRPEVVYARALVGDECDVERRLRATLETLAPAPFLRARIQLALGSFLRRQRRGVDSREPLESSAVAFEALGVSPWAERARQELRATGIQSNRGIAYRRELTPQERLIAQMAATGLSNRQIGQQLFLSPRTVGAHLYRIFPKLNVASRGELHRALTREGEPVAA